MCRWKQFPLQAHVSLEETARPPQSTVYATQRTSFRRIAVDSKCAPVAQLDRASASGVVPTLAKTPRNPVFIGEPVIPKGPQSVGKRLTEPETTGSMAGSTEHLTTRFPRTGSPPAPFSNWRGRGFTTHALRSTLLQSRSGLDQIRESHRLNRGTRWDNDCAPRSAALGPVGTHPDTIVARVALRVSSAPALLYLAVVREPRHRGRVESGECIT